MSLLGVDVGTGGLKAMAVEASSGRSLGIAFREYEEVRPQPGWVELSGDLVWQAFLEAVREINSRDEVRRDPISAMSFSVSCDEILPLDAGKRALANGIVSADVRGSELLPDFARRIDPLTLFRTTGVPLHPLFPLVRLVWYQHNRPEVIRDAAKFLGWGDLIVWRLGLPAVTDYSNASRWMAFDIRACRWATEFFDALELPTSFLPEALPSATLVGSVPEEVAKDLGFTRSVGVVTGAIDQICAAIGGGMKLPGDAVVGTGTWEVLTTLVDDPPTDEASLKRGFAYSNFITPGQFVGLASNSSGGALVRWFRDQFGQLERAAAELTHQDVYPLLLAEMPEEPTGILVLPHFQGSHNPWMDARSRGAVVGLTWHTSRGAFLKALIEGMTYELRANIDGLRAAGSRFEVLRNTGGGSRSAAWCQIKADILGLRIETVDVAEAGCLAAAILAGVGTGEYDSFSQPQEAFVRPGVVYLPRDGHRQRYDELYDAYKDVYPAVAPIAHRI
jgi:xylulokinase